MTKEQFDTKYNNTNSNASHEYQDSVLKLNGILGNLYIFENKVIFDRTGTKSAKLLSGLSGNKTIPMKSIQSVQFKEAGSIVNGFIQLGILGGVESTGGILSATEDENTIFFLKSENEIAKQVKEFIENKIYNESPSQVIVTQNVSTADELIKLKELQDKGIISKEEFEEQKLKLLQSK